MSTENQVDPTPLRTSMRNKENILLRPTNRSIPELISNLVTPLRVTDAATARAELVSKGMLIPAAGASINDLVMALFEFTLNTAGVTQLQRDMLRAIAILLRQADHEQKAKKIAETTTFHMIGTIKCLKKVVDSFAVILPQVVDIIKASETLKKNMEDLTQLRTSIADNELTPAPVSAALTTVATKECQILFEPATREKIYEHTDKSTEIAKKFEQAFSTAQTKDSPTLQIKATTRLQNRGLIIKLTTMEATNWACLPENWVKIIKALNSTVSIKEHHFSIIVPFLPIMSKIEDAKWQ
ncbi:hypothetical protein BDR04DRAFT_1117695 [Suillus decipiens]|nr:hypothetical protein BDR04DRAFT_1117695 [Suillus decipiens]